MSGFGIGDEDSTAPLVPDESLRDALVARFGEDMVKANDEANSTSDETTPPTDNTDGGEGSSPLPDPPSPSDGDEGGATASPDPTHGLTPTPPEEPPADGFVIADGETPPADTPTDAPVTPSLDDVDLNTVFTELNNGQKPSRQEIVNLLTFVQKVGSLPPHVAQQVNALVSGQQPPPFQPPAQPAQPQPFQQPTSPSPGPTTSTPDFSNFTDETRAVLEPLYGELTTLKQTLYEQQVAQQQAQIAQQQQLMQTGIQTASQQFVNKYQGTLTPTDLVLLETRVQQSGQFPFFLQQHNNDAAAAYAALLEATALTDPNFRAKIANATAAASPQQRTQDTIRQQKAASVAAGGTTKLSPTTPVGNTTPQTAVDKQKAMRDEIARVSGLTPVSHLHVAQ